MSANKILDEVTAFFGGFAPAQRGFYVPQQLVPGETKKVIIQPATLGRDKKAKSIEVIAILITPGASSQGADTTPDETLVSLVEAIDESIDGSQSGVNKALNGHALEFKHAETIKFVPPESHDPCAKAIFTLTVTYRNH
ncbi:hypothetical protein W04_3571 [Pseudoalteromonas sp. SW0106-04]|uniref:hypothetical protein n=1 Tax=Pseudoalteromonas sp. SW0106-04 TaxID=1702169 RepID=UPI0006B513E0|nr:hypothetical protein [Pseudoalteromonas sp. SW0106-04]GAP76992.1 hypothetical protein W04_3571 [Pseudoalteromonas sp. SW0106-04]